MQITFHQKSPFLYYKSIQITQQLAKIYPLISHPKTYSLTHENYHVISIEILYKAPAQLSKKCDSNQNIGMIAQSMVDKPLTKTLIRSYESIYA